MLENKRILVFLRSFDVGGAEKQAMMLANYLFEKEKAKVAVWAYGKKGPVLNYLNPAIHWRSIEFDPTTHAVNKKKKRIRNLKKLALKILFFRPHIILPFTIGPNGDCGCVWRWTLAKSCIWNQRDEWLEFLNDPAKKIEKYGFLNSPFFISNSKNSQTLIAKELKRVGRNKEQSFYVPNAIKMDPAKLDRSGWRKKVKLEETDTIVTMIGNLHDNKGHEILLKAWDILLKKIARPDKIFLLLAGRFDNNYQNLLSLVESLGIKKQVKFLDYVDDVSGLLKASDIGVFISRSEGCPNAVLESMSAGLPIVVADIQATRDILRDNYKFFANIDKPQEIADKLLKLINNKEQRKTIGEENSKVIKEKFNSDTIFKEYANIIWQTINKYESPITTKNIFQILKWQLSRKRQNLWESL